VVFIRIDLSYNPVMRTRLTDPQIWTMLNTTQASDEDLAAMMGVKPSTVHHARWYLSRKGWSCTVRYEPCRHCGELATLRGSSLNHAYHAACRPIARAKIQRRLDESREIPPEVIARVQQWGRDLQERTKSKAQNSGNRWTDDEDEIVIALIDQPIEFTCQNLGRSLYAVAERRKKLRRRGFLPKSAD
jgi:hypothetical protein